MLDLLQKAVGGSYDVPLIPNGTTTKKSIFCIKQCCHEWPLTFSTFVAADDACFILLIGHCSSA